MSTSMPDQGPIRITPAHISQLRRAGRGSLLAWDEDTGVVTVAGPGTAMAHTEMIVAGHHDLAIITDVALKLGHVCDDAFLANALGDFAEGARPDWPLIKALTYWTAPVRARLAALGVFLEAPPVLVADKERPRLREHYRQAGAPVREVVVTSGTPHHRPIRLAVGDPEAETVLWHMGLDICHHTPEQAADMITAAVKAAFAIDPALT